MPDEQPWWNDQDKVGGLFATMSIGGVIFLVILAVALGILKLSARRR